MHGKGRAVGRQMRGIVAGMIRKDIAMAKKRVTDRMPARIVTRVVAIPVKQRNLGGSPYQLAIDQQVGGDARHCQGETDIALCQQLHQPAGPILAVRGKDDDVDPQRGKFPRRQLYEPTQRVVCAGSPPQNQCFFGHEDPVPLSRLV